MNAKRVQPALIPHVTRGSPKFEIARILVASTAHLKALERERLFGLDALPARAQLVGEFSAMIWVPKEGGILDDENGNESDSEGLRDCLKKAREQHCAYILFDSDGPYVTGARSYEDDDA